MRRVEEDWKKELDFLQQKADEGQSMRSIAAYFGLSHERIRQIFIKFGLKQSQNLKRDVSNRPRHYKKHL